MQNPTSWDGDHPQTVGFETVEAGGIEPPSCEALNEASTCVLR